MLQQERSIQLNPFVNETFAMEIIFWLFKGYLSCKTRTFQNVSSEAKVKNFLIHRRVMFRSQDVQVFIFLTIPWFATFFTSSWVLVHEIGYIFEFIFWTTTHEVTKLCHLIDISKGNNFGEYFEQFGGLGLSSRSFSI